MTQEQIKEKREQEKKNMELMVKIYCKKNHKTKNGLCDECRSVLEYSNLRTEKCPHMQTKTFCAFCTTQCYKPQMKEQVRQIMRFSGPRVMFYNPRSAIKHLRLQIKEKNRVKKEHNNANLKK